MAGPVKLSRKSADHQLSGEFMHFHGADDDGPVLVQIPLSDWDYLQLGAVSKMTEISNIEHGLVDLERFAEGVIPSNNEALGRVITIRRKA